MLTPLQACQEVRESTLKHERASCYRSITTSMQNIALLQYQMLLSETTRRHLTFPLLQIRFAHPIARLEAR